MQKPKVFAPKRVDGAKRYNPNARIDAMYIASHWISFRTRFIKVNPLCYSCGGKSEVADHLIPHKGSEMLFRDVKNIIPLCSKCHNTITAKFDKAYIPGSSIEKKLRWIYANRTRNNVSVRVLVINYE